MASNTKHTEWILETIDHLRRRKARPDLDRICHLVRRRYGLIAAETEAKLEKLVDSEVVIKVDYKGSTSYRNAAKWRKSMLGCAVLNSTSISTKILEAILEISRLSVRNNTKKDTSEDIHGDDTEAIEKNARVFATEIGVSIETINKWLKSNCEGFDNLRSPLTVVLKREIDAGRVKRLFSCNYVITPTQMEEITGNNIKPLKINKKTESKLTESNVNQNGYTTLSAHEESSVGATNSRPTSQTDKRSSSTSSSSATTSGTPQPARRGRPPKHRPSISSTGTGPTTAKSTSPASASGSLAHSKLKRILTADNHSLNSDGSEHKTSKKIETRKASSVTEPVCEFCKLPSQINTKGVLEVLLVCKDCSIKAHPTCMNYTQLLANRAYRGPWQCMDCKTCCVCHDAGNPDQMLFCDGCDKGYHMHCHNPSVSKKPSGIWECSDCRLENLSLQRNEFMSRQNNHHTLSHDSTPPTPAESPVPTNSISNGSIPKDSYIEDEKYPDVAGWSVQDVVDYLTSTGFGDEAKVFLEQEIDGVALLLLKRIDVLKGLDLRLGPALKLNRHIQNLQMARQNEAI